MKTIKDQEMSNFLNGLLEDDQPVKFVSSTTVDYFDDDTAEITFQLDLEKKVKPLFPTKEQGAKYAVDSGGNIFEVLAAPSNTVASLAKQGRTFYTREDAEAFVIREQAKVYCLEAINRVNEGDNGFRSNYHNRIIFYCHHSARIESTYVDVHVAESSEYIRTEEGAQELIDDAKFVENFKIWKEVE